MWCGCVDLSGNLVWTRVDLCVNLRVVWLCGLAWTSCVELCGFLCGHLRGVVVWTCVEIFVWTCVDFCVDLCVAWLRGLVWQFPVLRPGWINAPLCGALP